MQSIFGTSPTPTTTPPPNTTPETDTDTDTTPETTESKPDAPVVRMPDGTEVAADTYFKSQVQEEMAKVNSEWDQVRQAALRDAGQTSETETPTSQDPPSWRVDVSDEDSFQSDVEKSLVNGHNALGEEVSKIAARVEESLGKVEAQVETLGKTTTEQENQRQIEHIERTKGVTEAEMQSIYNEYGGSIQSFDALAEIALSRKSSTEESETRTEEANNERKEAAASISGGGHSQTSGNDGNQEPGRGLTGNDIYNGAAIAAKYRGVNS